MLGACYIMPWFTALPYSAGIMLNTLYFPYSAQNSASIAEFVQAHSVVYKTAETSTLVLYLHLVCIVFLKMIS